MTDKVLCPWCGAEMWRPAVPWQLCQPEMGGYMYKMQGKCRHCGALTPEVHGRTPKETVEKYFAAALRRYEPPVRPLKQCDVCTDTRFLLECWIETETNIWHDLLDRNSVGNYGTIDNRMRGAVRYLMDADYGKTWRCWPRKPTYEEREAAGWWDAE